MLLWIILIILILFLFNSGTKEGLRTRRMPNQCKSDCYNRYNYGSDDYNNCMKRC